MTLSAEAFEALITVAISFAGLAAVVIIILFLIDWIKGRLW